MAMIAAGVGPGDRVATLAAPGLEFLVSFLASASVGAIWVGLNPRYADPELDALIGHMAPKLVFAAGAIERRDYRSWLQGLPNAVAVVGLDDAMRSEEHTSQLQSIMRISDAVFSLKTQ